MHNLEEFKIPIGPQHPALKEPESFSVTLSGERIMEFGVRLGYNHRGIEKASEERTYTQDVYLTEHMFPAIAWARVWAALVETGRRADGSVQLPAVLASYLGGRTVIEPPSP